MSATPSIVERAVRSDRALVLVGLAATVALAWMYLLRSAASMRAMGVDTEMHAAMGMPDMRMWSAADWLALFAMWAVMMAAMMLPSAAPVILLVLGTYRRRDEPRARVSALAFVSGYLVAWTAFSVAAAAAQVGLHRAALFTSDMRISSVAISGAVLVMAGVYQWLPLKNSCLTHCQSPLGFLSQYWREGPAGGLQMGLRHGMFCVGCCWLLMTLLFVVGVMNLLWVMAIAAFVLMEKLARGGTILGRIAGLLVGGWGLYLIATGTFFEP